MAEATNIGWTDSTFNGWIGCTGVSPGCDHCYAEAMMDTRLHRVQWGVGQARQRTSENNWRQPLKWNATPFWACAERSQPDCRWRGEGDGQACPACGGHIVAARRRVFCASLSDVFDNEAPAAWRAQLFSLFGMTPNLTWLLLTKRIGNVPAMLAQPGMQRGGLPANVWLGATMVNQPEYDRDKHKLLDVNASVRFVSFEPMLGPIVVDRRLIKPIEGTSQHGMRFIDWIICGGESGPRARPMNPAWARSLRDQCAATATPFFYKQAGGRGADKGGHLLDGVAIQQWPVDRPVSPPP